MKNLFKNSKENSSYQSPKRIPDTCFQDNTHCAIPISSRLSLSSFEELLKLSPARQMFLRYLRLQRLQGIFYCLRDLLVSKHCNTNCNFSANIDLNFCIKSACGKILNKINSENDENEIIIYREQLENNLEQNSFQCHAVMIYLKYFSIKSAELSFDNCNSLDCIRNTNIIHQMLVEIFTECHQQPIPSFQILEKCIYKYLSEKIFPNYLKSSYHSQYQFQMLSSGLNSLQLSDFIYSDEYIMIITEFLELKGLNKYLAFLLAVINLDRTNDKCSFEDILNVYSRYLVIDSTDYIEMPNFINNIVVDRMCSIDGSGISNKIQPAVIFECAFRPVYLFLEQYWLPEFLTCSPYQRNLKQLGHIMDTSQLRRRNVSENICNPPHSLTDDIRNSDDVIADNTSVQSEPVMSRSTHTDNSLELSASNQIWWPDERIEDRLSRFPRPMSLGSFDDLGRYQPLMTTNKRQSGVPNSTSSEILTTISEIGSDFINKLYINSTQESRSAQLSPDEIARQIISDVHMMTLINQ